MTEKRFINHDDTIIDNQGEQLISTDEIVEKLNELNEEIERQREFKFSAIRQANRMDEEKEKLKKYLTIYYHLFKELQKQLKEVKKMSDLDHDDFNDLINLSKGNVFDDDLGWIHLPIEDDLGWIHLPVKGVGKSD